MNTLTIRKFVLCAAVISICLVLNALVHQSVFNISLLCNSTSQHKTKTTPIIDTSNSFSSSSNPDLNWSTQKPLQDEENRELVSDEKESKNPESTAQSIFVPQNPERDNEIAAPDFSNFPEKNSTYPSTPSNFSTNRDFPANPMAANAPWPFCWTQTQLRPAAPQSPIFVADTPEQGGLNDMVPVLSGQKTRELAQKKPEKSETLEASVQPSLTADATVGEKPVQVQLPSGFAVAPPAPPAPTVPLTSPVSPIIPDSQLPKSSPVSEVVEQRESLGQRVENSNSVNDAVPFFKPEPMGELSENMGPQKVSTQENEDPTLATEHKMRPFPPVVDEEVEAGTEIAENTESGANEIRESEENVKLTAEDERMASGTKAEAFQDPTLRQDIHQLQDETVSNQNVQETGNFPLSPGEPQNVPFNGYFGVRKPVILPDVPTKDEKENCGKDDVLVIEDVSDLH